MDFSKRASNGGFRDNLQWGQTVLCFECATAVYTQEKRGQSSHQMEQGWLFVFFPLLQIKMQDITNNCRQEGERPPVLFLSHCSKTRGLWERKKKSLKVCSKHWTENWGLMRLFVHLLHVVTWDWFEHCRQQDIQIYSQATLSCQVSPSNCRMAPPDSTARGRDYDQRRELHK